VEDSSPLISYAGNWTSSHDDDAWVNYTQGTFHQSTEQARLILSLSLHECIG
jgi:hypothetical protein